MLISGYRFRNGKCLNSAGNQNELAGDAGFY